jgi:asparagine synthase (glutamine-hydrolysing)
MCGIVGIVRKDQGNAVYQLREMLKSIEHRGPDGVGIVASSNIYHADTVDDLDWDTMYGDKVMGHSRLAVVGGSNGQQPLTSNDGLFSLLHNGEIYNYKSLRKSLRRYYTFDTDSDSEVIVHLLAKHYNGDLLQSVTNIVPQLDGVYAIAVTDGSDIVIARDLIGVKQLYWVQNEDYIAFASEKKALWSINLRDDIHRLRPGEIIRLSPQGIERRRRNIEFLRSKCPYISDFEPALEAYRHSLREAVKKRIPDMEKVGLIFSGGIDSVLIASMLKEMSANVTCYVAGMTGSSDLHFAQQAAAQLSVPLRINSLNTQSLMDLVPKVISCIEDRSLGQVEVAIPILASAEMAHEDNQIVLFTGQGADELFGGYPWYRRIIELDGYDEFEYRMWDDLKHLYSETLEREDKITMSYGIELRVPYLDPKVIKTAYAIEPSLKIRSAQDKTGKYIHRALASALGIPDEISWRPKEAAQHGAGIHYRLVELAESDGFTSTIAEKAHYHGNDSLEEVLGSSQRYGYKYDKPSRWATQDHIQLWLDNLAYERGLLSPDETEMLIPYLQRADELITAVSK